MQLIAEKEILIVVASLLVYCCGIKKNVIVASQLYDVADASSLQIKKPYLQQCCQPCGFPPEFGHFLWICGFF